MTRELNSVAPMQRSDYYFRMELENIKPHTNYAEIWKYFLYGPYDHCGDYCIEDDD